MYSGRMDGPLDSMRSMEQYLPEVGHRTYSDHKGK